MLKSSDPPVKDWPEQVFNYFFFTLSVFFFHQVQCGDCWGHGSYSWQGNITFLLFASSMIICMRVSLEKDSVALVGDLNNSLWPTIVFLMTTLNQMITPDKQLILLCSNPIVFVSKDLEFLPTCYPFNPKVSWPQFSQPVLNKVYEECWENWQFNFNPNKRSPANFSILYHT